MYYLPLTVSPDIVDSKQMCWESDVKIFMSSDKTNVSSVPGSPRYRR